MGHVEKLYPNGVPPKPKLAPAPQGLSVKRNVNERTDYKEETEVEKAIVAKRLSDVQFIGIMLAEYWFKGMKYSSPVYDGDFVVCRWSDYHDGVKSNIEGKQTIAICRKEKDARLIFDNIPE